jgi:hypothetical protein
MVERFKARSRVRSSLLARRASFEVALFQVWDLCSDKQAAMTLEKPAMDANSLQARSVSEGKTSLPRSRFGLVKNWHFCPAFSSFLLSNQGSPERKKRNFKTRKRG